MDRKRKAFRNIQGKLWKFPKGFNQDNPEKKQRNCNERQFLPCTVYLEGDYSSDKLFASIVIR